jgi:hypothetical protein
MADFPVGTQRGACPTPRANEAENVEQRKTIVTHRRVEVNPKASAQWMWRLNGHAVLAGKAPLLIQIAIAKRSCTSLNEWSNNFRLLTDI